MKFFDQTVLFDVFGPLLLGLLVFIVVVFALAYFFKVALPEYFQRRKIKKSFESGEKWRDDQDLLQWLREMNPMEFEEYITKLFRSLGYNAHAVGHSGDHGVDVEIEKDGVTQLVQCKKYSDSHKVGEEEIRNFLGALDHQHSRGKGYFITTSFFTLPAEEFAKDKPIELVDGNKLVEYIRTSERMALKNGGISGDDIATDYAKDKLQS